MDTSVIPYLIIVSIFQLVGGLISGVDFSNTEFEESSIQLLTLQFFGLIGTFIILWLFMKYLDKEKFINLGFEFKNRFKEFNLGILLGLIIIMSLGYALLLFLDEVTFVKLIFEPKEIFITILTFIIVAVVEETLLRGYVLRNLMISTNKYMALIISSVLFSLMHGFNPNIDLFALTNLFLAGILLGLSYIHTKNLWFPIALHLSWNLFQTLLGFNVSGKDTYSIVEFSIANNNILNGGAFGFEGSILSIIAMLILILIIEFYYRSKNLSASTTL